MIPTQPSKNPSPKAREVVSRPLTTANSLNRSPRRRSLRGSEVITTGSMTSVSSSPVPLTSSSTVPLSPPSPGPFASNPISIPSSPSAPSPTSETSTSLDGPTQPCLSASSDAELLRRRSGTAPKAIVQSRSTDFSIPPSNPEEKAPVRRKAAKGRPKSFRTESNSLEQELADRNDLIAIPVRLLKGKYQIGDELGKGAFGRVFRGLNIQTGEMVAIKQFQKEKIAQESMDSVFRELNLMRKLFHTNIVNFYEYFETVVHLYFIIEFIEGGSLYTARKSFGKFSEDLLALFIAHVLRGLQYLHSKGIIHRDIKGANILLNKDGQCKVADFGSCNYEALGTKDGMVGSPYWMAPEIIEGKEYSSPASDLWSVGCMVIELINGTPPFGNLPSDVALFRMVELEHPPFPPNLSPDLTDFLKQCFIRDVQTRPLTVQLLTHPWITKRWGGSAVQESCLAPAQPVVVPSRNAKRKEDKSPKAPPPPPSEEEIMSKGDQPLFFTQGRLKKKIQDLRQVKDDLVNDLSELTQAHAQALEDQKSLNMAIRTERLRIEHLSQEKRKLQQYIRSKPQLSSDEKLPPEELAMLVDELEIILQSLIPPGSEEELEKSSLDISPRINGSDTDLRTSSSPSPAWPIPDWMQPGCRCNLSTRKAKKDAKGKISTEMVTLEVIILERGEKQNEMKAISVSTGQEGVYPFACFQTRLEEKPATPPSLDERRALYTQSRSKSEYDGLSKDPLKSNPTQRARLKTSLSPFTK